MSNVSLNTNISQELFGNLTKLQYVIIDSFLWYALHCPQICPSQETIARQCGPRTNRSTVNRYIQKLQRLGLLRVINVGDWDSCRYQLSDVFITFAYKIRHMFKSLKYAWNSLELCQFLPSLKSRLQSNFFKMSHQYSNVILFKSLQEPVTTYVDCQLSDTVDTKPNHITKEVEEIFSLQAKGDVQMIEVPLSPIANQIADELQLTDWGRMKITPFKDEALQSTLQQLSHAKPRNVIKWFVDSCVTYSKMNNLQIDWSTFYDLRDRHNMPSNAKFIKEKTVSHKSQSPRKMLQMPPEPTKEEHETYTTEQYMHFELHKKQPIKGKIDRAYVHPMFEGIQNPFLKEYNNIREERGLERLPEKDTFSWSIFEFELEGNIPNRPPRKLLPALVQEPVTLKEIAEFKSSDPIRTVVQQSEPEWPISEVPYMSDESQWEEV